MSAQWTALARSTVRLTFLAPKHCFGNCCAAKNAKITPNFFLDGEVICLIHAAVSKTTFESVTGLLRALNIVPIVFHISFKIKTPSFTVFHALCDVWWYNEPVSVAFSVHSLFCDEKLLNKFQLSTSAFAISWVSYLQNAILIFTHFLFSPFSWIILVAENPAYSTWGWDKYIWISIARLKKNPAYPFLMRILLIDALTQYLLCRAGECQSGGEQVVMGLHLKPPVMN